jgi:hypothetical protein
MIRQIADGENYGTQPHVEFGGVPFEARVCRLRRPTSYCIPQGNVPTRRSIVSQNLTAAGVRLRHKYPR